MAARADSRRPARSPCWCRVPLSTGCCLPYFGWQFFHYQKQNLGIAALAAASQRVAPLRMAERRALTGAGLAGIAGLLARPSLLQLPVRPILAPLFPVAAIAFAGFVAVGVGCLAVRSPAQRPAGFCVVYLTSLGFSAAGLRLHLAVCRGGRPDDRARPSVLAAHGLASGRQARARRPARPAVRLAALCNIALLGGAALSIASDQAAAGPALRILFGLFLGAVMAHFVVDAGLWRMREEFPRSFLRSRLPYLVPAAGPAANYRPPIDRLPI